MGLINSQGLLGLMDATDLNQRIIANNLANVNTPGYKTARLGFKEELTHVLDGESNLLPGKKLETDMYRPLFRDAGPDSNDVSMEREIVELNKNTLRMKLYLGVLSFRIRILRSAIDGKA